jgi:peptidoglycan hydrolase-like amidase
MMDTSPARAGGPGSDEVSALYAKRFSFDRRGIPLISVRIVEGQTLVAVSATGGVRLLPHGVGTEVLGVGRWTVEIRDARPARVRHWVVVERIAGAPGSQERQALEARWRGRGLTVRTLEVGALFAVGGRVVDNRSTLVVTQPEVDAGTARAAALRLGQAHRVRTTVHPELLSRATGQLVARPADGRLAVVSADALWFAPAGAEPLSIRVGGPAGAGRERRYGGRVVVTADRNGKLAVVNELPADHLLNGLLPAEIYVSAPLEALKAQAVAARGQLFAKIGTRHTADPYLVCGDQHCQVYSGAGSEHPRTSQAVSDTRGQILVDARGRLADTVYSASCGGALEHNEHVWNTPPNPHLRGHLDAPAEAIRKHPAFAGGITERNLDAWLKTTPPTYCATSSFVGTGKLRWSVRLPQAELDRLVRRHHSLGAIRALEVIQRGVSGRAIALRVKGTAGETIVHGELEIRRLLGGLKSSMFVITRKGLPGGGAEWLIRGGGWGHGVGLCQTGAIGMAEARHGLTEILAHYYPGTRLLKLY